MSTWIYLECLTHEPPLRADMESGQHLYDLPQIQADLASRDTLVAAWRDDVQPEDYFRRHTVAFLASHPLCSIGIRDEYGDQHAAIAEEDQS